MVVSSDVFMLMSRISSLNCRHGVAFARRFTAARSFVVAGGLMAFGIDRRDQYRRVAAYVSIRILKGEKAAELPVQQPVKFEFAINLKTAGALGLAVPTGILCYAPTRGDRIRYWSGLFVQ